MNYLKMLKSQLEVIQSNWSGDENDIAEERFNIAEEAIEKIESLLMLLEELKNN